MRSLVPGLDAVLCGGFLRGGLHYAARVERATSKPVAHRTASTNCRFRTLLLGEPPKGRELVLVVRVLDDRLAGLASVASGPGRHGDDGRRKSDRTDRAVACVLRGNDGSPRAGGSRRSCSRNPGERARCAIRRLPRQPEPSTRLARRKRRPRHRRVAPRRIETPSGGRAGRGRRGEGNRLSGRHGRRPHSVLRLVAERRRQRHPLGAAFRGHESGGRRRGSPAGRARRGSPYGPIMGLPRSVNSSIGGQWSRYAPLFTFDGFSLIDRSTRVVSLHVSGNGGGTRANARFPLGRQEIFAHGACSSVEMGLSAFPTERDLIQELYTPRSRRSCGAAARADASPSSPTRSSRAPAP